MLTPLLILILSLVSPAPRAPGGAPLVEAVGPIGITVADLDRSVEFYTSVLTFEKTTETETADEPLERLTGVFGARARTATLHLGQESITLTQFLAPEGRPVPADTRANDRWFQHVAIVVADMDAAYAHLRRYKVRHASSGPQRLPDWNPAAGGIEAFYFKDPDGHHLELIHFPTDKGDPRWHAPAQRLFLGIDHTAIVVRDTDTSLSFYRDTLGLRVAGTSENHGVEQEHLNNVFGARLRITTLRAARGPGIELLEYLAPSDGRDQPYTDPPARACDLVAWNINLGVASLPTVFDSHGPARLVSSSIVTLPDGENAFRLTDPDHHVLEFRPSHGARP